MSIDDAAVQAAIEAQLATVPGLPNVVWIHRTAPAEPEPGVTFVRAAHNPGKETILTVNADTGGSGLIYLEIWHKYGDQTATDDAISLAAAIKSVFVPSSLLPNNTGKIMATYKLEAMIDAPWRAERINIEYNSSSLGYAG